jgi:hypothetical protein
MLHQDHLGLIADLDHLRAPRGSDQVVRPVQECYVLLPVETRPCGRCGQASATTLVLGLPDMAICAKCDPLASTADFLTTSFDEDAEADGWPLA